MWTTILRAIQAGELEAARLGRAGDFRIAPEALTAWLRPATGGRPVRIGSLIGRSSTPTDGERELRVARITAARHNPRWTEIPDDLVSRGRCLVSAATDDVFLPH